MILNNPIWGKIPTLSASKIKCFFSCGQRFLLEYIHGLRASGGPSAARGRGLHKAIETDNKEYIKTHARLGFDILKEIGEEEFEQSMIKEGVFIPKKDIENKDKIIQKARHELIESIRLYADMDKPWEPVTIEEHVEINIGYPLPMVAYMDMTDEDLVIWDWKTAARKGGNYRGIQNMIYSKIFEKLYGVKPTFKYCIFIIKKEPEIDIQTLPPVDSYEILDKIVDIYLDAIEKEVFLPSTPNNFLCSEGGCPFYLLCELKL